MNTKLKHKIDIKCKVQNKITKIKNTSCDLFASDVDINLMDTQWCAQSIYVLICCFGDG